jgi:transposase
MLDYSNKTVYLGIDVHKKTYSITAICDDAIVKRGTMNAVPQQLISYCRKFFPGAIIISAYEAGFSGLHLHRKLVAAEIKNIVVNPASIEIAARDRVKNDKRDSLKIATKLSKGSLKCINIVPKEREEKRLITRIREQVLRHRKRIGCQLKAVLHQFGLIAFDDERKVSEKWLKSLTGNKYSLPLKYCVEQYSTMWLYFNKLLKELDIELECQAQADPLIQEVYISTPGIGLLAARNLANELGNMSQFSNEKQIFSYVGLTPQEHSSGEHKHLGSISKQGNSQLRKILIQASWVAIKKDQELNEIYQRIANRSTSTNAIVAVARRLIGRIRACFKNKCLYKIKI